MLEEDASLVLLSSVFPLLCRENKKYSNNLIAVRLNLIHSLILVTYFCTLSFNPEKKKKIKQKTNLFC